MIKPKSKSAAVTPPSQLSLMKTSDFKQPLPPRRPKFWPVFGIEHLGIQVKKARQAEKHLFIWDKTGSVTTVFETFGLTKEFKEL